MCSGFPVFLFVNAICFYCIFSEKEKFSDPSVIKLVSYVCKINETTKNSEMSNNICRIFVDKFQVRGFICMQTLARIGDCLFNYVQLCGLNGHLGCILYFIQMFVYGQTFDIHPQTKWGQFSIEWILLSTKKDKNDEGNNFCRRHFCGINRRDLCETNK